MSVMMILNNIFCNRECCDGLVKPVNLFEEAADHSGEVKNKKKEVMVRQARLVASKLCQYCVVICDSRGLSTVVCDNKAHWPNILVTASCYISIFL